MISIPSLSYISRKPIALLLYDLILVIGVAVLAWVAFFSLTGNWPLVTGELRSIGLNAFASASIISFLTILVFQKTGLYTISLFTMNNSMPVIFKLSIISLLIFLLVGNYFSMPTSWPVVLIYFCLLFWGVSGGRLLKRYFSTKTFQGNSVVIVFGAGKRGIQLLRYLNISGEYRVVAIIDEKDMISGNYIDGVMVHPKNKLSHLIYKYDVTQLFIAVENNDGAFLKSFSDLKVNGEVKINVLPSISDLLSGKYVVQSLDQALTRCAVREKFYDQDTWDQGCLPWSGLKPLPYGYLSSMSEYDADNYANTQIAKHRLSWSQVRFALEKCQWSSLKLDINADKHLAEYFYNETILIMGAGSVIGRGLAQWCYEHLDGQLILLDQSEALLMGAKTDVMKLTGKEIEFHLPNKVNRCDVYFIKANYSDLESIKSALIRFEVDRLLYCAYDQQISLSESSVVNAVQNNILDFELIITAVLSACTPHFTLVSTDQAVRPTSVMGATRRFQEQLVLRAANYTKPEKTPNQKGFYAVGDNFFSGAGNATKNRNKPNFSDAYENSQSRLVCFSIVRLGNIIEDEFSTIAVMNNQIIQDGHITLSHPQLKQHFIGLGEAVHLLFQANKNMKNGEVYVIDMGPPVLVSDLAEQLLSLAGATEGFYYRRFKDVKYTGLKPGEKLIEESLIADNAEGTCHSHILKAIEWCNVDNLSATLNALYVACAQLDIPKIISILESAELGYKAKTSPQDTLWLREKYNEMKKQRAKTRLRSISNELKEPEPI